MPRQRAGSRRMTLGLEEDPTKTFSSNKSFLRSSVVLKSNSIPTIKPSPRISLINSTFANSSSK